MFAFFGPYTLYFMGISQNMASPPSPASETGPTGAPLLVAGLATIRVEKVASAHRDPAGVCLSDGPAEALSHSALSLTLAPST